MSVLKSPAKKEYGREKPLNNLFVKEVFPKRNTRFRRWQVLTGQKGPPFRLDQTSVPSIFYVQRDKTPEHSIPANCIARFMAFEFVLWPVLIDRDRQTDRPTDL
jgi:hypothetical protein